MNMINNNTHSRKYGRQSSKCAPKVTVRMEDIHLFLSEQS